MANRRENIMHGSGGSAGGDNRLFDPAIDSLADIADQSGPLKEEELTSLWLGGKEKEERYYALQKKLFPDPDKPKNADGQPAAEELTALKYLEKLSLQDEIDLNDAETARYFAQASGLYLGAAQEIHTRMFSARQDGDKKIIAVFYTQFCQASQYMEQILSKQQGMAEELEVLHRGSNKIKRSLAFKLPLSLVMSILTLPLLNSIMRRLDPQTQSLSVAGFAVLVTMAILEDMHSRLVGQHAISQKEGDLFQMFNLVQSHYEKVEADPTASADDKMQAKALSDLISPAKAIYEEPAIANGLGVPVLKATDSWDKWILNQIVPRLTSTDPHKAAYHGAAYEQRREYEFATIHSEPKPNQQQLTPGQKAEATANAAKSRRDAP